MTDQILLSPGPTQVPEDARQAMSRELIHHRTPQFAAVMREISEHMRWLYQTEQPVLMLTCSGTGAFEAAMINFTRKQDKILCVGGGKFGERWAAIGRAYGMTVIDYGFEWGQAADPAAIDALLAQHPDCTMVTISASETSSGVFHPIEAIAEVVQRYPQALFAVDGITAVGVHPLPMDALGIDVLVTGSQKALSVPPGLAFVGASARAWERYKTADHPKYYLDLGRERKNQEKDQTAFTPAITIALALVEVLRRMRAEGLEAVHARHALHARAAQAGLEALGLELFTSSPTFATTAALVPESISAGAVTKACRDLFGVTVAGGQDHLKPRLIRIGHLGYISRHDLIAGMSALELALQHVGHAITPGAGVAAAQRVYLEATAAG